MPARFPDGPGTKGSVLPGPVPELPIPGDEFFKSKVKHGTESGNAKHLNEGTEPCDPCRQAKAFADWRRLQIPENTLRNRLHAKAQSRAHMALVNAHYTEYRTYYDAYKVQLLEENGLEPRMEQPARKTRGTRNV